MSLQKHQVLSVAHNAGLSFHEGHNMQSSVYAIVTACESHCMQGMLRVRGFVKHVDLYM